jgi:hypothetical protein
MIKWLRSILEKSHFFKKFKRNNNPENFGLLNESRRIEQNGQQAKITTCHINPFFSLIFFLDKAVGR